MTERYVTRESDGTTVDIKAVVAEEFDLTSNAQRTISTPMAIKIDEPDSTTTYVGEAIVSTLGSNAKWRIKKIVESGTVTAILWADGNQNYDNIWDNRASLSYS